MEAEDSKGRGATVAVKQGTGFNPFYQRLIGVSDLCARGVAWVPIVFTSSRDAA